METKEQLELEKSKLEARISELNKQLEHAKLPEKMRMEWDRGFGWPKLRQELSLDKKLEQEDLDKLFNGVSKIIETIANMVPPWENTEKGCWKCDEIRSILNKSY